MSVHDNRVTVLLANAETLLTYNTQTQVLPSSRLEEVLREARKQSPLDFHSDEAIALRNEVARVVQAIKPATLSELENFAPYTALPKGKKSFWDWFFPYFFAVFTACLFLVCAKYTIWSKDAAQFMSEVQTAQRQLASERFAEVLARWDRAPILERRNAEEDATPSTVSPESDFRVYKDQYLTFQSLSDREQVLNRQFNPVQLFMRRIQVWRQKRQLERVIAEQQAATDSTTPSQVQALTGAHYFGSAMPEGTESPDCLDPLVDAVQHIRDEAEELGLLPAQASSEPATDSNLHQSPLLQESQFKAWAAVQMRQANLHAFACFFDFPEDRVASVDSLRDFYLSSIRLIRNRLDILNSWVLPGIYGALGAVLLTLTVYVNPVMPKPRKSRTTIRVLLGAFVGIVIGWFWSPQSNEFFEFANISLGLFTMAFLFGYGIDVFMSMLDRLVGFVAGALENDRAKR